MTSLGELPLAASDQPSHQLGPSDLCRSCGLCCDGTLFGRVRLQPEDPREPLRLGGIVITGGETDGQFKLACAAHHGCCQVYESRPSNCRTYQCKLLRRFGGGVVTWAEAAAQISRLRRLREQLGAAVELVRPGMGRASVAEIIKIAPTFDELAGEAELHRRWAPVMLRLVALRRLSREGFHGTAKAATGAADGDREAIVDPCP